MQSKVKVVVTGASGFLGKQIAHNLRMHNQLEVVAVTRKKLEGWFIVNDYSETPEGDFLIHLAENSNREIVNKLGTFYELENQIMLKSILKNSYKNVIYISSALLYGDKSDVPHLVSDELIIGDTYSKIKRNSELSVLDSSGGVVVRASNLYGIGMSDANVVNKIFSQIPGKGPLKIINDKPIRDFLYIQDAVSGIISLLIYYLNHSGGGIYNLGTGIGTSIRSLASLSLKMAGESHRIIESESVSNANSCLVVNCNETTKICGWKPNVKLSEGISNIIEQRNI